MRILGSIGHIADKTTTTNMLTYAGMTKPEIMTNTVNLFEGNLTTFSSFLTRMGLSRPGVFADMTGDRFRVVGNRKIMWRLKGPSVRKGVIIDAPGAGNTPGINGSVFTLVINTDFFSPNDNLELVDRTTLLHVLSKEPSGADQTTYRVKLVHNQAGAYVDPTLITAGKEIGFGHTMFPELSEDASEKTTFGEWHTNYLGIQRMKHTISGSARASKLWLEHNGQRFWDYAQNIEMMERISAAKEHQYLFGQATIDANDRVYVQDDLGRDLPMGDGIINQGDPSLRFQYNTLTIKMLEKVMENLNLQVTNSNMLEVAVCGGQVFNNQFQRLMRDQMGQTPNVLFEKNADGSQGIRTNFSWYEFGGVRLHVMRHPYMDSVYRPIERDQFGNSNFSERAFFCSLGNTIGGGDPNVELVTLGNGEEDRRMVTRIINGMTGSGPLVPGVGEGGKYMLASSPVDGMQVHALWETGLILRDPRGFAQLSKARRR